MEQPKISINFYRDTDAGSQTQGAYWLELYKNGKYIDKEPFTEQEVEQTKELKSIVQMEGLSGHVPLHEWLKKEHKPFFEKYITDSDRDRIVGEILKSLQDFFYKKNNQ